MERKFINKEWEYVVTQFVGLSRRKNFVTRFRLDYYLFAFRTNSPLNSVKGFINSILGFFSEIRYLLIFQLGRTKRIDPNLKYIVHISDSKTFLKTIVPICEMLLEKNGNPIFLCPANHYHRLVSLLTPQIAASLYRYEQIQMYPNKLKAVFNLTKALFLSVSDIVWFTFQPLRRSFSISFSFGRHSFIHHYSDDFWKGYFSSDKKTFVAAEDQYLWEAALFANIHSTPSLSFVFQHGKLSDVYYPTTAKCFCTFGIIDVKKMVDEFQAAPSEVLDIGSPYYDAIYNQYHGSVRKIDDKLCITFFAQPWYRFLASSVTDYSMALSWFYKLSTNKYLSNYKFVLKLHPQDHASFYASHPSNIEISADNLFTLINRSLIALTIDSSTIFEAAFCGVPSLQTIPTGNKIFMDESYTGVSMKVSGYDELESMALKLALDKTFYEQCLIESRNAFHSYFSNLGHSIDAIKELLLVDDYNQL